MTMTDVASPAHGRLLDLLHSITGPADPTREAAQILATLPLTDPHAIRTTLLEAAGGAITEAVVTSTLDARLVLAEHQTGSWTVAELSGRPLAQRTWPTWARTGIHLTHPDRPRSTARIDAAARHRLLRPRVLIAALYHPEWFPLPRFSLAISDLARAARHTLSGQIRLMDMQLGATLDDIAAAAADADIVGISATFGQHDLLVRLLHQLISHENAPMLIAGGSLTARNERQLVEQFPRLLVARGPGERTTADLIAHWHGDTALTGVRGIGYQGAPYGGGLQISAPVMRSTAVSREADFLPELDLLDTTLKSGGVAQLEISRGCTSACSFCPRDHKGKWSGGDPLTALPWFLHQVAAVFDRHPGTARVLYAVDEEFIGRGPDAVPRALKIAQLIHDAGFAWESSCRVEQVARPDKDTAWHIERARMWRTLVDHGLRRMLFGIESGVDSILTRFHKDTTAEQNCLAVRTLTALGVPPRFTYITFDHLMTRAELAETVAFQGRTDLLLKPLPALSPEEIVAGVRDEDFVRQHSTGQPFYTAISYMNVSMECLIGAPYTRMVTRQGLAGAPRPALGRVDADFLDPHIGAVSRQAQLWIDRTFAYDYALKSLEKITTGPAREALRQARVVIKHAAYRALVDMTTALPAPGTPATDAAQRLRATCDDRFTELVTAMAPLIGPVAAQVPPQQRQILVEEHRRWSTSQGWVEINAADPCGT